MLDRYDRLINTLRVSITDRCNQNCLYCRGKKECSSTGRAALMSFEEIVEAAKGFIACGIDRIKLTGGEPLMRRGVVELVQMLSALPGLAELSMTTNGVLLETFAADLKRAGLMRVNISLDSLNRERYREITGGGDLDALLRGIEAARSCGLSPVKINTVYIEELNGPEIEQIRAFCRERGLVHQLINRMDIHDDKVNSDNFTLTDKPPRCSSCCRLRLTADGKILPCLFSGLEIALADYETIEEAIGEAVRLKPVEGERAGRRIMKEIGG